MTNDSPFPPPAAQSAARAAQPSCPGVDADASWQATSFPAAVPSVEGMPRPSAVVEAAAADADADTETVPHQPTMDSPTAGVASIAADDAMREPRDSSEDGEEPSSGEDVDAWLHDVLQRVQPGCEITVNALHMLGELFETVRA